MDHPPTSKFERWARQNPRDAGAVALVLREDFFAEYDREPTAEELENWINNTNLHSLAEFIRRENRLDATWALGVIGGDKSS